MWHGLVKIRPLCIRIMVGMCGEAAADTRLIPRFLDMGINELSMSPASILAAKKGVAEYAAGSHP